MKVAYRKHFLKDLAARFGDYRVGLSVTDDTVTLERVLNRKEISLVSG